MTIDVGTGDGRAVLDAAAREPTTLVLGLDAIAAAMVESSRRAAGPAKKGGRPNARFVLASAELPPEELVGSADLVTVRFPWGSLLRGVVGLDEAVANGVASLVAPGGAFELLVAPAPRDRLDGIPTDELGLVDAVVRTMCPLGLIPAEGRAAKPEEVTGSSSTWAKRLLSTHDSDRRVMLVRLVRAVGAGLTGEWNDGADRGNARGGG